MLYQNPEHQEAIDNSDKDSNFCCRTYMRCRNSSVAEPEKASKRKFCSFLSREDPWAFIETQLQGGKKNWSLFLCRFGS